MKIKFDQSSALEFTSAHGRKPRGQGRWSFRLHRDGEFSYFAVVGSYAKAKAMALKEAKGLGCESVSLDEEGCSFAAFLKEQA